MTFQLKAEWSLAKNVKRLARKEFDKALERLTDPAAPTEAVHDARKRFKKVRALLRLARKGLGGKTYQRENVRLRDAGRGLNEVRDAQVLITALDKLTAHYAVEVPLQPFLAVHEVLLARQQEVNRRILAEEDRLAQVADEARAGRRRCKRWSVKGDEWSILANGLKRVYKRGARALSQMSPQPTVEALHEWRKQVKYLWHQFQFLRPMQPERMSELEILAHDLATHLGDDHDLAMLHQLLAGDQQTFGGREAEQTVLPLIVRRRAELQEAAFECGRKLFRDGARTFVERLESYWCAWRSEKVAAL